jgi:hypothetical protein
MTGDAQLDALVAQLDRAQQRLHRLTDSLSAQTWAAKPRAGAWSAAECVDHLNLTSRAFLTPLTEAVAQASTKDKRYRMDAAGWVISIAAGPLMRAGRWRLGRIKTTAGFVPAGSPPLDSTVAAFDALQRQLKTLVGQAAGRAIDRVRITSPFEARVSYSAYSAFVIIPRHQIRHIEQAEESADLATRR